MNLIKWELKPKLLDDFLIWNINIAKLNYGIIALFKKTMALIKFISSNVFGCWISDSFLIYISCEYTLVYWWLIDFPVQMSVFSANVFLDQLNLVNVQSGGALKPSHVRVCSTKFW